MFGLIPCYQQGINRQILKAQNEDSYEGLISLKIIKASFQGRKGATPVLQYSSTPLVLQPTPPLLHSTPLILQSYSDLTLVYSILLHPYSDLTPLYSDRTSLYSKNFWSTGVAPFPPCFFLTIKNDGENVNTLS
jgi:hypothetical protein